MKPYQKDKFYIILPRNISWVCWVVISVKGSRVLPRNISWVCWVVISVKGSRVVILGGIAGLARGTFQAMDLRKTLYSPTGVLTFTLRKEARGLNLLYCVCADKIFDNVKLLAHGLSNMLSLASKAQSCIKIDAC
ncbi:11249_t:CDS:2 [Funneliformis caledonium]|uniref:11249_t:CDS:1 n=1 Tax=Funneliformis caledonium TaxID=1117310 RepID=A0A9N9CU83_9GLOM|nr:11249_t:CDS:2 [Funneliformis caledonium]